MASAALKTSASFGVRTLCSVMLVSIDFLCALGPDRLATHRAIRHTGVCGHSASHRGDELVHDVARGHAGDLRVVVCGCDLDHVSTDDVQVGDASERAQEFAAREAPSFGGAGARRMGGVEHVDVDRDVEWL